MASFLLAALQNQQNKVEKGTPIWLRVKNRVPPKWVALIKMETGTQTRNPLASTKTGPGREEGGVRQLPASKLHHGSGASGESGELLEVQERSCLHEAMSCMVDLN